MTRRERLERKAARREEWAEKAAGRAADAEASAHSIADMIPLGQPILVGHHSERRARRDRERIRNRFGKAAAERDKAAHHRGAAAGIQHHLDASVFTDDPDAIEALEARIAANEKEAELHKRVNAAWRKGGAAALKAAGFGDKLIESVAHTMALCPWLRQPLDTTNLRAAIRRDKQRIGEVRRFAERAESAERAGGVLLTEGYGVEGGVGGYCTVTFAEKPARAIIDALKAAGFWWAGGSWNGEGANLPPFVREMASGQKA